MRSLLWIGDAACGSGFGRASHHILQRCYQDFDKVTVLGINYRGFPHKYPYEIYPAMAGGDQLGFGLLGNMLNVAKPTVIVIQSNPWNFPRYRALLTKAGCTKVPVVAICAVEGKNCVGTDMGQMQHVIFWNRFSQREAILGSMMVPSTVIPLGVDLETFTDGDREEARAAIGLPHVPRGAFMVTVVNRNQHRKRIDLSLIYFAEWIKSNKIQDAYLYLHVVQGSGNQINCDQLADYLGITSRVIWNQPKDVFNGSSERAVVLAHQACNVGLSTALGEGWGLNTMEGMACRRAQIGGDYSGFQDWAKDAMILVPCPSEGVMPDVNGMIGGIPDKDATIAALDSLYRDKALCNEWAARGLARVSQPQYRWETIAIRFSEEINRASQFPVCL